MSPNYSSDPDEWEVVGDDTSEWEIVDDDNYATRKAGIEPEEGYGLGETVVRGFANMPRQFVSRLMQMQEGVSAEEIYDQDLTGQYIEKSRAQTAEYLSNVPEGGETFLGFSQRDVAETLANLPYSAAIWAAMAAGMATPVPGATLAAGLVGGKRMASNEFARTYKDSLDQELMAERGSPLSQDEWAAVFKDFEEKADAYGWWESIPETVGSMFGARLLFGGMKSIVGAKIADKVAGKISGLLGKGLVAKTAGIAGRFGVTAAEEVGQEVVTGMGQAGIEYEMGLRPEEPTVAGIYQEVKNPTLLTTMFMGAGGAAGIKGYQAIKGEEKDLLNPDSQSWQQDQRTQYMEKILAGVSDGSITISQIQQMRQGMDESDPLAQTLDDIFFKQAPSTAGLDYQDRLEETSDFKQRLKNQAEINEQNLAQPLQVGPAAAPVSEPAGTPLAGIRQPLEGVVPSKAPSPAAGIERGPEPEYRPATGRILPGAEFETPPPAEEPEGPLAPPEAPERPITDIDIEAHEAATSPTNELPEPTEAQKEAGNYKKGHIKLQGFDITIENPEGSIRTGTDQDGETWETEMVGHYGYFKRSEGKDGDQIDVFVGPNPEIETAFIVDQVDPETGEFDEHKVLMGYDDALEAASAYRANYEEGWQGLGNITEVSIKDLKEFIGEGRQTEPYVTWEKITGEEAPAEPKLSDITVKIKALNETTGSIFEIEEDAQTALNDTESKSEILYSFLECLK